MSELRGKRHAQYIRQMFGRIAKRYNLLNSLITLGQVGRWRRETIRCLNLTSGGLLLDLGTGTGDLAKQALREAPHFRLIAADYTEEMIAIGRKRNFGDRITWVIADASSLPFADGTFDGIASSFLLRNVANVDQVLAEQYRVLQSEGNVVSLETTPPPQGPFHSLLVFHLQRVVPFLGRLVARDEEAYRYLSKSTEGFLTAQALADRMKATGFRFIVMLPRMWGTIVIHQGWKPRAASLG